MTSVSDTVISRAELRRCYGGFATGVVAVCALVEGTPIGMVVSAFTPISLDPPMVGVFFQRTSSTWPALRGASHIGLSFLAASQTHEVNALSVKVGDRFAGVDYEVRESGAIVVREAMEWLEVVTDEAISLGDHDLAAMRVCDLSSSRHQDNPMVFYGSRFRRLAEENSADR